MCYPAATIELVKCFKSVQVRDKADLKLSGGDRRNRLRRHVTKLDTWPAENNEPSFDRGSAGSGYLPACYLGSLRRPTPLTGGGYLPATWGRYNASPQPAA